MTMALAKRTNDHELDRPMPVELMMPAMSIDQMIVRYDAIVEFTKRVMKSGRDYGVIPGTDRKSDDGTPTSAANTLLKPGAEKLCTLFGLVPEFEDYRVMEDWDKGIFYYAYRCVVYRDGHRLGEGIGSANSRERKYRRVARLCPECHKPTLKRSRYPDRNAPSEPPGWYCDSKAGGCGSNFVYGDPKLATQQSAEDPTAACDFINTLQKMAQKRALVAAVLITTNASEFFTQDVEDLEPIGDVHQPTPQRDLQDDEFFLAEWDRLAAQKTIDQGTGRMILRTKLGKRKIKTLADADIESRKALLADLSSATPEQVEAVKRAGKAKPAAEAEQKSSPSQESRAATEDLSDAGEFFALVTAAAPNEDLGMVLDSVQRFARARHRNAPPAAEASLSQEERRDVLAAVRENRFDFVKAEIMPASV